MIIGADTGTGTGVGVGVDVAIGLGDGEGASGELPITELIAAVIGLSASIARTFMTLS